MNRTLKRHHLLSKLTVGEVYSWRDLESLSGALGRDLKQLQDEGYLRKVGPGLYLLPKQSRFGTVPPSAEQVVSSFLKGDDYLLVSPNYYNSLGLGLTQLRNEVFVYNNKRHGDVKLANRTYHFKVKLKGYPKSLTKEYLLVDLVNNLETVGELPSAVLKNIADSVKSSDFNNSRLFALAKQYGLVYTKKFFSALERDKPYPVKKAALAAQKDFSS
jgi:hypothetical protein